MPFPRLPQVPRLPRGLKTTGIAAALAFTIGSNSSEAVEVGELANSPPRCLQGEIIDVLLDFCIPAVAGAASDLVFAEYSISLAKHERAAEGLEMLKLVANPEQPRVQNSFGFVMRVMGDPEGAVPHYLRAIELDPGYHPAREYLGEAYIILGQLDLAREQLAELGTRCGVSCAPFTALEEALAAAPGTKPVW